MKAVTTCHQAGLEQYGHRLLENKGNLPCELVWYTEGYEVPCQSVDLSEIQSLEDFKDRYTGYRPPDYIRDVVRFSNKVFAAWHGLKDYRGIGVWVDADCVPYKPVPKQLLLDMLGDAYLGLFRRAGFYTETGFWLVNGEHAAHEDFMDTWVQWYQDGSFKNLGGWTDCHTLDATVRMFEKSGAIKVANLSGEHTKDMHPMAKVELGKYLDHTKGPRKKTGKSPENAYR